MCNADLDAERHIFAAGEVIPEVSFLLLFCVFFLLRKKKNESTSIFSSFQTCDISKDYTSLCYVFTFKRAKAAFKSSNPGQVHDGRLV